MGILSNPWQGIDRFIRHPVDEVTHPFGHKNKWQHFKNDVKDAGIIAGEVGFAMATGGESVLAEGLMATAKNWGSTAGKSLAGTAKKQARVAKRKISKAVRVPYKGKSQDNSAMKGGNPVWLVSQKKRSAYMNPDILRCIRIQKERSTCGASLRLALKVYAKTHRVLQENGARLRFAQGAPNIEEVILWKRIWQRLNRYMAVWTIYLVIRGVQLLLGINQQTKIRRVVFMAVMPRMPESATIVIGEDKNSILFMWLLVL